MVSTGPHSASVTAEKYEYNFTHTHKKPAAKHRQGWLPTHHKHIVKLSLRRTPASPTLTRNWLEACPSQDLTTYQDFVVRSDKIWNKLEATIEVINCKYLLLPFCLLIYHLRYCTTFSPAWGTAWRKFSIYIKHTCFHVNWQQQNQRDHLSFGASQLSFQMGESVAHRTINIQPFIFIFLFFKKKAFTTFF